MGVGDWRYRGGAVWMIGSGHDLRYSVTMSPDEPALPAGTERTGSAMPAQGRGPGLAVFDMDGTLTRHDTFLPWLDAVAGRGRVRQAFLMALPAAALALLLGRDARSMLKEDATARLLRGVPVAEGLAAARRIAPRVAWRPDITGALEQHRSAGRRVLVATATPEPVARILLESRFGTLDDRSGGSAGGGDIEVLGSMLEQRDGLLTGRLAGGNCARALKAERVAAWMAEHGPFGECWGYGNRPHDLAMLALMDHAQIV